MTMPGILRVTVQDTSGNSIPGATVTLTQSVSGAAATLYSDANAQTPLASNVLISDGRGQAQAYGYGEFIADVRGSGVTTTLLRLMAEGEGSISPMRFGAVGNGVADDTLPVNTAISVAKVIGAGAPIVVDGAGRKYAVTQTIKLEDTPGVLFGDAQIFRHANWSGSGSDYMIKIGKEGNRLGNAGIGLFNLTVDAGTQQPGILVSDSQDALIFHVRAWRWTTYGLRILDPGNSGECRVIGGQFNKWFFSDPEREDWAQRTGVGISVEMADCILTDVISNYCATPLYVDTGGCNINGGHFYNGAAEPPRKLVSTYGSNGSGALRIVTSVAHGYSTGELILLPWMPEISPSLIGGNTRPWACTVVDTTTVDFLDYPWAGATFVSGSTRYLLRYSEEPECARIAATASGVMFCGTQFDNGKLVIEGGATAVGVVGARWVKSGKGYNLCDLELATTRTGEDWAGILANGCMMNAGTSVRQVALGSGTIATVRKCMIYGNTRADGGVVPAVGRMSFPGGSRTSPGLLPGGEGDDPTAAVVDFGTGLYSALGETGLSVDAKARVAANSGGALFGDGAQTTNQTADVRSVSTQSAKFGAGTWASETFTPRWRWGRESSDNWTLAAHDATGTFIANDITVVNGTGLVTIGATSRSGVRVGFRTDFQTTAPSAGGGAALPATPAGYIQVEINGTVRRIAYY